ncbi:hypothetical protein ACEN9X_06100 [Mucilaginibacter sp. Mucisp86]
MIAAKQQNKIPSLRPYLN